VSRKDEDHKFKASLGYIARAFLKRKRKEKRGQGLICIVLLYHNSYIKFE
jgi:hypothetical protein